MSTTKNKTRPASITITLAGVDYGLKSPLNLGQLRDIGVGCAGDPLVDNQAEFSRMFDSAVNIISVALKGAYPEMTSEKILASTATTDEMWKAMNDVLAFAGLVRQPVEKASGEAPPGTS
jgi:hypothetical protein